jgi:hypothetical protein
MARYFFDTSALVKRYHVEAGTDVVDRVIGEAGAELAIARLTPPGYRSDSWREMPASPGFRQSHQVLYLQVIIELRGLFGSQAGRLFTGEQIQDMLSGCLRRLERRHGF